jgi:hypothetical protein
MSILATVAMNPLLLFKQRMVRCQKRLKHAQAEAGDTFSLR